MLVVVTYVMSACIICSENNSRKEVYVLMKIKSLLYLEAYVEFISLLINDTS